MLKRRTIAMLVAGTLIGAQAGIAANEESTASDTYLLVPVEQAIVLEPVVLSETDVSGPTSDLVVIEQTTPMIIAVAEAPRDAMPLAEQSRTEPSRDAKPLAQRDRTFGPSLTVQAEKPFKGHPMNVSETAGWNPDAAGYQQRFTQYPDRDYRGAASRDYRSAANFPMNVSETAGISPQSLEQQRLAQAGSDYRVASVPSSSVPRIE